MKPARWSWRLAMTLALALVPGIVRGESLSSIYRRCLDAGFEVLIDGRHAGSAWLADKRGYAITAAHLMERRNAAIELLCRDNRRLRSRLVARDRAHDVALLEIAGLPKGVRPLQLARDTPKAGEEVVQFGAPLFRSGLLQAGRVAAAEAGFEFHAAIVDYAEVTPVAAMMQGGTSGGPWLNRRGQVVGVQSSTVSLDDKPVGVAYFAPLPAIRRLLETRRDADTPTPGLGVDELWQQPADYLAQLPPGATGLVASVVRPEGPAARAGIESRDLLVQAGDRRLVRIADLTRTVRLRRPGDMLSVKFLRPGETRLRETSIVLTRAEDIWPGETAAPDSPPEARP